MGDRCCLHMTMRREDLPRFAQHVYAGAEEQWWDELDEQTPSGIVTVMVHEANYAWMDERLAAAQAGIPFYGTHEAGGEYGPGGFVSWGGALSEVELDHDGNLYIPVDESLRPLESRSRLRKYVRRLKKVRAAFAGKRVREAA